MRRRRPLTLFAFPLFAAVMVFSSVLEAQVEKTLRFIPQEVDFGVIREENGKTERTVKAVNVSSAPTFIISARTSCGCTSAKYSGEVIAPGDTTEITVGYDPANRPGKFLKTAKIFTGDERISNSFKLKGTVIPSARNLAKTYPDTAGQLRLSARIINVGELRPTDVRPVFIGIYNDSPSGIRLEAASDSPALQGAFAPDSIEPFGVATLTLTLRVCGLPADAEDFSLRTAIINASTADTITSIPLGGIITRLQKP